MTDAEGAAGAVGPAPLPLPDPPYHAVVFTSLRDPSPDDGYAEAAARMEALAAAQPGYLGLESARGADGVGVTVSYWATAEAAAAWGRHAEHRLAQAAGRDRWYRWYVARLARVERAYLFLRAADPPEAADAVAPERPASPPVEDAVRRFADAWVAAWNAHDLEAVLAHYADDVAYASPFVVRLTGEPTGTLRGTAELRPYFAAALAKYPDLHFRLRTVAAGVGSLVLVYESVEGLLAAEVFELDAAGRAARVRCHYTQAEEWDGPADTAAHHSGGGEPWTGR